MNPRIDKVAYIGWRSLDYEEIELDPEVLTGLIGPGGAGKTTLAICLCYALLPDRKVLEIRPISEVQDPHAAGLDLIASLINAEYGHAYVVLDISTRMGTRMIAGIQVSIKNGRGEFKPWVIRNVPREIRLHEIMRVEEGESEYYPDLPELSRKLANSATDPMDLEQLRTVNAYGEALHEAGILPTDLVNPHERNLYAKLIETSFKGGLTNEVATKLKDYLLPPVKRIPEIVSQLQECTDQVLKTRHSLRSASEQLDILESVYGTGKDIVRSAIEKVSAKRLEAEKNLTFLQEEISSREKSLENISMKPAELDREIKAAEDTLKSVIKNHDATRALLNAEVERLVREEIEAKSSEDETYKNLIRFRNAEKLWIKLAGSRSGQSIELLLIWFKAEIDRVNVVIYQNEQVIEKLLGEKSGLDRSSSDAKTDALSRILGRPSLGESFDDASEEDALSVELTLGGITSGILNCTPEDLADVSADETLPDIFWIGKEKPQILPITKTGDWHLSARGDGGYTVFSKNRKPILGARARKRRQVEIDVEIDDITSKVTLIKQELEQLNNAKEQVLLNDSDLRYFLENKASAERINTAWFDAKGRKEKAQRQLKDSKTQRSKLESEISEVTRPYQSQIAGLKEHKIDAEAALKKVREELTALKPQLAEETLKVKDLTDKLAAIRILLGNEFEGLSSQSPGVQTLTDTSYPVEQTKRIDRLNRILEGEPPARLQVFQEADPTDDVSCVRLWPVLKEILRDRVPAEVLDNLGDDMIKSMRERRSHLDTQLHTYEKEVRIKANSIYLSLKSEIRAKQQQIKRLNKLGEKLQFGNIVGIRINVITQDKMLSLLQNAADQVLMYSADTRPIEEILVEFFDTQMNLRLRGEDLLDYRTYMDLVLEVQRKNEAWDRASSLSGTESIGCGVAICLMLARSLASRSEIRSEQITPLFVIDEANRLDDLGQQMIIDFGKREGFQVLVTAPKLEAESKCTLYVLSRVFHPEERLVIRGLRIKETLEKEPSPL